MPNVRPRTVKQLRKLWDNLKQKWKRAKAAEVRGAMGTEQSSGQVEAIIPHLLERPSNPYDRNRLGRPAPGRPVTVDAIIDNMTKTPRPNQTRIWSSATVILQCRRTCLEAHHPLQRDNSELHAVVHDNSHGAQVQPRQADYGAAAAPRTGSQPPGTRNGLLGQTLAVELDARLQALRDEHEEKSQVQKQKALHEEHALKMKQLKENHADELAKREVIHDMQVRLLKAKLKTQRLKARLLSKQLNDKAS
ncbi:hypothetical protein HPB48_022707 [Haemaphysalis longicornis]|uniref:Uncharacterized protein n=1 Tax=Haemaphysalis longicornis TaxID=44386 RepID=A0A9J6FM04_HAELO|nr:hypothetical protein HPB48_022707 [Haemaphysalis longicornis]